MAVNCHVLDGKVAGRIKLSIRNSEFGCPEETIESYATCYAHHGLVYVHLSRQEDFPQAMQHKMGHR